jgi:hypothetical protein
MRAYLGRRLFSHARRQGVSPHANSYVRSEIMETLQRVGAIPEPQRREHLPSFPRLPFRFVARRLQPITPELLNFAAMPGKRGWIPYLSA